MTQVARTQADGWLAELHPAYFALVMATGIVSIGAKLLGIQWVPQVLFSLNLLFYPTLWLAIPQYFIFVALTAWSLAFFGMIKRVVRGLVGTFAPVS